MVLHMLQPDINVWALCVDHTGRVPLSLPVRVQLSHRSSVYDLKKAIKEEMKTTLQDVDAPKLIVWKLEEPVSYGDAKKEDFLSNVTFTTSNENIGGGHRCHQIDEDIQIWTLIGSGLHKGVWFIVQCPLRKHCPLDCPNLFSESFLTRSSTCCGYVISYPLLASLFMQPSSPSLAFICLR
jgi:hypothetical protein